MIRISFATVLALAVPAAAEPTTLPGEESGRVDRVDAPDSTARVIARGALFVPRFAVRVVLAPFEGVVWASARYQIPERVDRLLWNDAGTVGLLPTLSVQPGFGVDAGAHFVHKDLGGADERLDLRAGAGGRYRQRYLASLHSGRRFGRLATATHLEYERRPRDAYYGTGNDDVPAMRVGSSEPGVESRFRHDLARASSTIDLAARRRFHVRAAIALSDHEIAASAPAPASVGVGPAAPGLGGYRTLYSELEVRHDSRRTVDDTESASNPSTGSLVAAFAGRVRGLDGSPDFWRYGADVQRLVRLAAGPRVLALRVHAEGVTGPISEVPFGELPRLGGVDLLRGYPVDRFRDRLAIAGSAEYRWDLTRNLSATLFADAGRVYRSPRDLTLDGMRVGYGVALEAHTDRSYLARISLASSIDGGVFLDVSFDPAFEVGQRVQRR